MCALKNITRSAGLPHSRFSDYPHLTCAVYVTQQGFRALFLGRLLLSSTSGRASSSAAARLAREEQGYCDENYNENHGGRPGFHVLRSIAQHAYARPGHFQALTPIGATFVLDVYPSVELESSDQPCGQYARPKPQRPELRNIDDFRREAPQCT